MFQSLKETDSQTYNFIQQEQRRQREELQMIPSENYASRAVLAPLSTVLCNKYSEGYPGRRYYRGNKIIDGLEELTIDRVKKLFSSEYANVQPLSGTQANIAVYLAFLKPGDKILSMELSAGGHFSHGYAINFTGQFYQLASYGVNRGTEQLDYDEIQKIAEREQPKLIIAGASAYPRIIDFSRFAQIARSVKAFLMADIAHIAGLVAAGEHPSPVPMADVVTLTTHKTLRGPRGGVILASRKYARRLDKAVFPGGVQGGPHNHVHAAKAVCFKEAFSPLFKDYARQIIKNSQQLAADLLEKNYRLVSGGTDNHLLLIDLRNKGIDGCEASLALEKAGIIVNKNMIPFDPGTPKRPSGIRLGTPALTTRGMKEKDMEQIVGWFNEVLENIQNEKRLTQIKNEIKKYAEKFPLPGV